MNEISIYVHIPFCKEKCLYCDFLSFSGRESGIDNYVDALIKEITAFKTKSCVKSIFIGGGTPSYIDSSHICRIMEAMYDSLLVEDNAEITIEANPGTVDLGKLKTYRGCGINRISIGVQAWQDRLLKKIGRIHGQRDIAESVAMAKEAGFENINCDLMFALPSQTCDDFLETIDRVTALDPAHISAYSLIIEEGTPFYGMYERGIIKETDEATDRKMYHEGIRLLKERGYSRYEISNFAKDGYKCRHNLVYWYRGEYKGFGLGAASLINNQRFKNTEVMEEYLKGVTVTEGERLSVTDMQEEFMFLGLRCDEGVSEEDFFRAFGVKMDNVYGKQLKSLVSNGLITRNCGNIRLTEKGFDLANMVFVEFMQ